MTIREKVARAIKQKCAEIEHRPGIHEPDIMWFADEYATAAINTFLEAAAEQGWHMRPDEATEKMGHAGVEAWCDENGGSMSTLYRAMLAAAPEFEWDK